VTVAQRVRLSATATIRPSDPTARALTWATFATSFGTGLFYSISALLFTRGIGLTATTVGYGLAAAGAVGVISSFGAGFLADRFGAKRLLMLAMVAQGMSLCLYAVVNGVVGFVIVACCATGVQAAARSARQSLIATSFTGPSRVDVRARLRVVTNVSIGLGTCLAAIALIVDTAFAYRLTVVFAGLLTTVAVIPVFRVRQAKALPRPTDAAPRSPLRDRTYLAATALIAVMSMQMGLFSIGVPLWITTATAAPTVLVSVLLVVNTILVALFQVRASRGTHDVRVAGVSVRRAGLIIAAACGLYAAAAYGQPLLAAVILLVAGVAHTIGELWNEAGSWGLAFELADPGAPGAYQGVSQAGVAIGGMLAPAVVTATALQHGAAGWAVLAVIFVIAGVSTEFLARVASPRAATTLP
jgi:MFS family permease